MQLDVLTDGAATQVGSYFVANYSPFSVWFPQDLPAATAALSLPAKQRQRQVGSAIAQGLPRVDALLPRSFELQLRDIRYT